MDGQQSRRDPLPNSLSESKPSRPLSRPGSSFSTGNFRDPDPSDGCSDIVVTLSLSILIALLSYMTLVIYRFFISVVFFTLVNY